MTKKHRKVCLASNYFEKLLILVSVITGCVSISVFVLLVDSAACIASSTAVLKICARNAGIK